MNRSVRHARIVLGVWLTCAGPGAFAAAEEPAPAIPAPASAAPAAAPNDEVAQMEKKREAVRQQLDGSRWTAEVVAESDRKTREDALSFSGRTVSSEWLAKEGFGASNFSLRFEDEMPVWETMQVSESKGTAFLKGELHGQEKMSGVLSKQLKDGTTQNYFFSATKLAAAAAAPEAPAVAISAATHTAPAAKPAQANATQQAPKKTKKRRGLF